MARVGAQQRFHGWLTKRALHSSMRALPPILPTCASSSRLIRATWDSSMITHLRTHDSQGWWA